MTRATRGSSVRPAKRASASHREPHSPSSDEEAEQDWQTYFNVSLKKVTSSASSRLADQAREHAADYKRILHEVDDPMAARRNELENVWVSKYSEWAQELRSGFNLLFYGYGCKREAINAFARSRLGDGGGLVVIHPRRGAVTSKRIALATISALSGKDASLFRSKSVQALIEMTAAMRTKGHVYLVLHGLDAPSLRSNSEQEHLSHLAACPAVRLVASVDHIHAGLLFDSRQSQRYDWLWKHVPTWKPMLAATAAAPAVLQGGDHIETKQSAAVVLAMLTQASRSVFRTFAEALLAEQLDEQDEIEGLSYEHLFRLCRERFLVNSDATMRPHLTEFRDHDLTKSRKGPDGVELLYIPLPVAQLRTLVADLSAGE